MAINESLEFDIDAPVTLVIDTLADVEALPDWSSAHSNVKVVERDANGRPSVVDASVGLMMFSDNLTFDYVFTDVSCKWDTRNEGTAVRSQGGIYELSPKGDDQTHVKVTMYLDPKVKAPGFVVKKGIKLAMDIIKNGLTKEVMKRKSAA